MTCVDLYDNTDDIRPSLTLTSLAMWGRWSSCIVRWTAVNRITGPMECLGQGEGLAGKVNRCKSLGLPWSRFQSSGGTEGRNNFCTRSQYYIRFSFAFIRLKSCSQNLVFCCPIRLFFFLSRYYLWARTNIVLFLSRGTDTCFKKMFTCILFPF